MSSRPPAVDNVPGWAPSMKLLPIAGLKFCRQAILFVVTS